MSWWNTSNFTDLASKALKNAQKKIDKALEISEEENAAKESAKKESSKEKQSDFWGGWGLTSDGSPSGASAGGSSWSLPWGAGSELEASGTAQSESLIREKTPEEIKSEVLKAAKERSRAKSKLFPRKEEQKLVESVSESSVKDEPQTLEVKESEVTSTEPLAEPESALDTQDKDIAELSVLQQEGNSQEKENEQSQSAIIESGFQEVEESDAIVKDSESHVDNSRAKGQASEDLLNAETVQLVQSGLREADSSGLLRDDMSEIQNEHVSTTVNENESVEPSKAEEDDLIQHQLNSDIGQVSIPEEQNCTDISSSVEVVSKGDLPLVDNAPALETVEYEASDPEIVECDKVSSDEDMVKVTQSDFGASQAIEKDVEEISESNNHSKDEVLTTQIRTKVEKASVSSVGDKELEAVTDNEMIVISDTEAVGVQLVEDDKLSVASSVEVSDSVKPLVSSDSEASMYRLDTSVETCTSDETLIEQCSNQGDSDDKSSLAEKCVSEEITEYGETNVAEVKADIISDEQHKGPETCETDEVIFQAQEDIVNKDNVEDKNDSEEDSCSGLLGDKGDISPAHSFVKCMIEDAAEEGKHDDSNSDSHSATEKSEGSRSIYSNQESGDEIDTNTSSDIEIISLPTPNGENRVVSPLDPIPLRMALQKSGMHCPSHKRTDSSDSSNASKDGNYGELSPGRDLSDFPNYHRSHSEHQEGSKPELPALTEEDDNPYHPQRLVKDEPALDLGSEGQMPPQSDLDPDPNSGSSLVTQGPGCATDTEQKLAEVSEILVAREEKLLQLSKDNCDLMETNSILRSQLKQSEEAHEAEMADVNELTAEFTQRLTDAEKRVSAAIKEKEALKQQLSSSQAELARKAGDASLKELLQEKKELLEEKEEMIAGLLQEGEKLSKSQLQSNNIIKKLRQKEKDNDSTITALRKKVDTQKEELDHLKTVLDSKEETEKKNNESIAQLTSSVKKMEQEMVRLKSEHEDATEKARGLQVALDKTYKEMAELHRTSAAHDSKAQEAALSVEMSLRDELKLTLEKQQQQHKWEMDTLTLQIEDHRMGLARMEKEYNRREDLLKQEIADLQKQLQEDEDRNQELTQGVSQATRPLLRQIENLQSTYNAQYVTWERVEKSLTDRLSETQTQLAVAVEKERTSSEKTMELSSRVTSLETQNATLRQERSQTGAQLEILKSKLDVAEEAKDKNNAYMDVLKQQMSQEMQEVKKQKVMLETQLDVEKSKVEQERKKISLMQEQLRDMEHDLQRSRSRGTPTIRGTPSPVSVSRQESVTSSLHEHAFTAITQEELDRSFSLSSVGGIKQSLYESLRQSGAANLLDNLQSQLKQREGEIHHLQSEIRHLEGTREAMARELVDLSNKNEELEHQLEGLPHLQEQLKDLDQRYNALLQMYGEKVEEADELRLDLQDVKDMYKAQINHLLGQS